MKILLITLFNLFILQPEEILQSQAVVIHTQLGNKIQPSTIKVNLLSTKTNHNIIIGYMWAQSKVNCGDTILIDYKFVNDRVFILTNGNQFRK